MYKYVHFYFIKIYYGIKTYHNTYMWRTGWALNISIVQSQKALVYSTVT